MVLARLSNLTMTAAETRNHRTALHQNLISSPFLKNAKFSMSLKISNIDDFFITEISVSFVLIAPSQVPTDLQVVSRKFVANL